MFRTGVASFELGASLSSFLSQDVNAKASRPEQRVVMSLFCIGLLFFDGNGSVAVLLFVPVVLSRFSCLKYPPGRIRPGRCLRDG